MANTSTVKADEYKANDERGYLLTYIPVNNMEMLQYALIPRCIDVQQCMHVCVYGIERKEHCMICD